MTRNTPVRFLRACGIVLRAGWHRGCVRLFGREIRPPYLAAGDLTSAERSLFRTESVAHPTAKNPPLRDFPSLPPQVLEWAREKRREFEAMLREGACHDADPEAAWTLHQMGWLFVLTLAGPSAISPREVNGLMEAWLARFGHAPGDPSWRSYSISERVCHWLNIIELFPDLPVIPPLADSIGRQVSHLTRRLEEYCDGTTNNHIVNNGRALYRAGRFLGCEQIFKLGQQILIHEADRRVTREGFLDEGSSHYQLLIAKNYMETLRAAEGSGDQELIEALREPVAAMLRACAHLRDNQAPEEWHIPYFGDISPDLPPALFGADLFFWTAAERCARGEGASLSFLVPWFGRGGPRDKNSTFGRPGWHVFPRSGYYRWNGPRFSVWWHVRPSGAPRQHAHNDWGSFQLNLGGQPVIIDPGRPTYRQSSDVSDKRLTLEQNSVMIDVFEQAVPMKRNLFDPEYLNARSNVCWSEDGESAELSMAFRGYERLRSPLTHTRTFRMNSHALEIHDHLDAQGSHQAVAAFHLHPAIRCEEVRPGHFMLVPPQGSPFHLALEPKGLGKAMVKRGGPYDVPGGFCSTQYGTPHVTTSIFAQYEASFPARLNHVLSFSS